MEHESDNLVAFAAGTLPPEERRRVAGHVSECADCRAELESWKAVAGATTAGAAAIPEPPPAALDGVWHAIGAAEPVSQPAPVVAGPWWRTPSRGVMRALQVAAALLVVLGVTAALVVNPISKDGSGTEVFAAASAAAAEAKTSKFDMKSTQSIDARGISVTTSITSSGAIDYENQVSRVSTTIEAVGSTVSTETITTREFGWVKVPDAKRAQVGGKEWVRVPIGGLLAQQFQSNPLAPTDPAQAFDHLRSAADVTEVGPDEVRGEDTTKYTATVNLLPLIEAQLQSLVESEGPEAGQTLDQARSFMRAAGFDRVPFTVWVDDDERVRKVDSVLDLGAVLREAAGAFGSLAGDQQAELQSIKGEARSSIEFFDYGSPVEVRIPGDDVTYVAESVDEVSDVLFAGPPGS